MIELIRVRKKYPKGAGVRDVSLRVDKGQWVNIVGRSGAGKTTLLRMIYAEVRPDAGEVIVGDWKLSSMTARDIPYMRRLLGIVDQDLALIQDRSVYENVTLVGEVLGWSRRKIKRRALDVLNRVGLYKHLEQYPSRLSFGEQRRLAIARALVGEPFALVADEPLGSLDKETATGILQLLASIHQRGTAVVLTTHQPEMFGDYPVREVRVDRGKLVEGER
jgi:cell division transport system ATP-binding protein